MSEAPVGSQHVQFCKVWPSNASDCPVRWPWQCKLTVNSQLAQTKGTRTANLAVQRHRQRLHPLACVLLLPFSSVSSSETLKERARPVQRISSCVRCSPQRPGADVHAQPSNGRTEGWGPPYLCQLDLAVHFRTAGLVWDWRMSRHMRIAIRFDRAPGAWVRG